MARHCSFCYGRGHNRATCPEIKKNIRNEPDGFYARQDRAKKARRKNAPKQHRECGYCQETGHNKRTCENLTNDRKNTLTANKKFARDFITVCKKLGFAPGTLMAVANPETIEQRYTKSTAESYHAKGMTLAMVIGWNEKDLNSDLTVADKYLGYKDNVVRVRFPSGRKQYVPLPKEFIHLAKASDNTATGLWTIGCPVDANSVAKGFSDEWKDGSMSVEYQLGLEE